jgi:protoheme IX farnesyltransferase
MAIAWLYRDDYRKAGFPMLSVIDSGGTRSGRQAVLFAAALIPVSLAPITSVVSFTLVLALGLVQLGLAVRFAITRSDASARALFIGSITYLPLLWTVMILGKP